MKSEWPQSAILHAASLLAPGSQRAEWLAEWRSELWYIPRRGATRFCLGAFPDALWLRRNAGRRAGAHLASPLSCLALLGTLAAVSIFIGARLETMLPFILANGTPFAGGIGAILLLYLLLAAVSLMVWGYPARRSRMGWTIRLRGWIFLTMKMALLLPIMQCGLIAIMAISHGGLTFAFVVATILAFRWVFADQRRRCPICLRLLTGPVRIGTASETFLDWYGAESMCSRGHGLLHAPEVSASYSPEQQWLRLDGSWRGLF